MLKIAHRGASGYEPENTLSSFKKALELGVDMIELDVHITKDGKAVVIHDETVDRTTTGNGYVKSFTFAELCKLDAGKGEVIPTLEEVLDLINKQAGVNIELKGDDTVQPTIEIIQTYIAKGRHPDSFLISSFNHHLLHEFKALMPEVRTGVLISAIPHTYAQCATDLSAYSINLDRECINQAFIDDAHNRNLKVFVRTVNEPWEIEKISSMGVEGIISNYPDRIS